MQLIKTRVWGVAAMVLVSAGSHAEDGRDYVETRHGAVPGWPPSTVEAGITLVGQRAGDRRVEDEITASMDLVLTLDHGPGHWSIYLEGNTTPDPSGVSALVPEANGDAGSALDRHGRGRVQVSELHYVWELGGRRTLLAGLVDTTASLDTSDIANDETGQFLTSTLVNNPTIGFPDHTLGLVYNHGSAENAGITLMAAGSHGLADNPDHSYGELFDVTRDGKGVFVAAEYQWQIDPLRLVAGAWNNGGDHDTLDGGGGTRSNRGAYASLDVRAAGAGWNLRAGVADERVAQSAEFVSVAVEYPFTRFVLGAGAAHTWLSSHDRTPGLDDATQLELHARFGVGDGVTLTPVVQRLSNPGFVADGNAVDKDITVVGLRANVTF